MKSPLASPTRGALFAAVLLMSCQKPADRSTQKELPHSTPPWEQGVERPKVVTANFEDVDFLLETRAPRRCASSGPLAAPQGMIRLSIPIHIKTRTTRTVPVGALLFTLEDREGHVHRPTLAGCSPAFAKGELKTGEEIEAEIAFDVPEGTEELELIFEPFLVGRKKLVARVSVPPLGSP